MSDRDDRSPSRVRLRILDKEVQLACPPDEEDKLRQAAAYVDRAMRETRQRNTTSTLEKIAIVTAINTASSLLDARSRAGDDGAAAGRVARLNARLDGLLTTDEEPTAMSSVDERDVDGRWPAGRPSGQEDGGSTGGPLGGPLGGPIGEPGGEPGGGKSGGSGGGSSAGSGGGLGGRPDGSASEVEDAPA